MARSLVSFVVILACAAPAMAQLTPETVLQVDAIATQVLAETGEASVSLAIVRDGKVAYAQAYGWARLEPRLPATPQMRYKIGSNSKQFLGAAVLLLAEEGKLSLDDKVARYFPQLSRAQDITLRQLLSHTAGYSDYYPLDYIAPFMAVATTPQAIMARWGRQPLNFTPDQRWEYSNTNYVIAGQMAEKAVGQSLTQIIRSRITDKLGMRTAIDINSTPWSADDPLGYQRYAEGPLRVAVSEGRNWAYAAGQLAMSAGDLALWDIALLQGKLLKPTSQSQLLAEARLSDGGATGYALGLVVDRSPEGRARWHHSGGMSGFISFNRMYPDDGMALVVLTNGPGPAAGKTVDQLERLLLALPKAAATTAPLTSSAASLAVVRQLFAQLQAGQPDRKLMSSDLSSYFTATAVADFAASLQPLGALQDLSESRSEERGGMTSRGYRGIAGGKQVRINTYFRPDGLLDQFLVNIR
ncbi:beta-lactamase family protein [Duganella sp. sic0402]|uniref:serine hydrolase domain-containing protein n=1 Tax=Duganella sp. sic0402 TaxID=2854786 RepID=UPI001C44EB14|nr:serine hydrolase domain-containing protein [Duganella sp. sic0402]MBV7536257.1 beta-lactamase family protein [Duganella sp. sic0402]